MNLISIPAGADCRTDPYTYDRRTEWDVATMRARFPWDAAQAERSTRQMADVLRKALTKSIDDQPGLTAYNSKLAGIPL